MGIGCLGKIEKLELQFFRIGSRFQMSCMECEYDPFIMPRMMFYTVVKVDGATPKRWLSKGP